MKLIACNSHPRLAQAISDVLGVPLTQAAIRRFSDMEIFVEILESVRGEDTFVVQSTSFPANDHLMELLITIDALKRGSARRITAVMPYFGYARQDRKSGPRSPISAKLVANLLTTAGVDRVLMVDLHTGQIQGFFDIPTDNLYAAPVFRADIHAHYPGVPLTIVSPDVGGVFRARQLATRLNTHLVNADFINADLAIIDKRRSAPGESEVMHVIGQVEGRHCILVDDIIDSGGTLCQAAKSLVEHGAASVAAYATHGVFSGQALERVMASPLTEVCVSDSIMATSAMASAPKIRHITLAPLLAQAIAAIAYEKSISTLFE